MGDLSVCKQLAAIEAPALGGILCHMPLELQPAPEHAGEAVCTQASIPQDPTGADGPMLLMDPSIHRQTLQRAGRRRRRVGREWTIRTALATRRRVKSVRL